MAKIAEMFVKIGADISDFEKNLESISASLKSTGQKLTSIGMSLSMAVTAPLAGIGFAATKMAMDAVESENLFEVSMGGMADAARAWSEDLRDQLGLNAYELRENVATFNQMFTSMGMGKDASFGMAKGLTQLSYDMASFFNLKPEEAFLKLQAGITGEIEPLKRLGIVVNETTVKTYAYTHGIAEQGTELTEQQKILARYGLIMEQTKNAQGDLARTINSPTNQLRIMREQVENLSIDLGMALLPVLQNFINAVAKPLLSALKAAVDWFKMLSPEIQQAIVTFTGVVAAIGPVAVIIGTLVAALGSLINPIGIAVVAIGGLVTAGILLYQNWDKLPYFAEQAWGRVKIVILTAAKDILSILAEFEKDVSGMFGRIIQSWLKPISEIFQIGVRVGEALRQGFTQGIIGAISEMFTFGETLGKSIAEGQKGPLSDTVTFLEGKIQEQQGLLVASAGNFKNAMGTVSGEVQTAQANISQSLQGTQDKIEETGEIIRKRTVPEFHNLADVQREMAKEKLPALKSAFVTFRKEGIDPSSESLEDVKLITSQLNQTFFPEIKKSAESTQKSFSDMGVQVSTTNSLIQTASEDLTTAIKGLWEGTTTSFEEVWKSAASTFIDIIIPQIVAVATGAAQTIQWSMAAATAGISLVIGMLGTLFGGKKHTKITVEPLTDRLEKVFNDFVNNFKSSIKDFKDKLFPVAEEVKVNIFRIQVLTSAISTLSTDLQQLQEMHKNPSWDDPEYGKTRQSLLAEAQAISNQFGYGKVQYFSDIENVIADMMKNLSGSLDDLSGLMVERFNKIKDIVGNILGLYQKQKDFTKDISGVITDVQRSLLSPEEMLKAQIGDIDVLKKQVAAATGEDQISLLGELKDAYLAVWGTAKDLFSGDTGKLLWYQGFVVDGLETIKKTGESAYDKLIDIQLESLGIQRIGVNLQTQMTSYLGKLDRNIETTLRSMLVIAHSGIMDPGGLSLITTTLNQLFGLPKLQHGGIISGPTLAMVGEAGPEAVIPLDRIDDFKGGRQTIIIELDGRVIAKKTVQHMPSILRLQGVPI